MTIKNVSFDKNISKSFPQYDLDLPWAHTIEGYLHGYRGTFVMTYRDDPHHPFVVHEVGIPLTPEGPRGCHHGDYFKTRSEAFERLVERHVYRNARERI